MTSSRFGTFWAELRRRHVARVTIAYAAAAFVLIEAGDIVLGAFGAPEWALRVLVLLVFLGFPIAVVLAWVYDVTPKGIRRTEALEAGSPGRMRRERLLPRVAFLVLTVATATAAGWWLISSTVPQEAELTTGSGVSAAPGAFAVGGTSAGPITSLAVLPLDDFSDDPQPDYFAAGMHEALIYRLSQIEALRIVSRTSTMRYAEKTKTAPQIASELDVQGIVEGSVLRAGGRVRITVQLIDARNDTHIWSNSYERPLEDIISLQSEVARAIADEIQAELTPDEMTRLAMGPPVDPQAHEAYLQGRFEQSKGTPDALEAARQHYEQAVEIDSSFAPAYAALAGTQLLIGLTGEDTTIEVEVIPQAFQAAERALILDEGSDEARAVLAEVHRQVAEVHRQVGEVQDSVAEELQLIYVELDTLDMPGEEWAARFTDFGREVQKINLKTVRTTEEAVAPEQRVTLARRLAAQGERESAIQLLESALEREPDLIPAWEALEHLYTVSGDYKEAARVRRERAERMRADREEVDASSQLERAVEEEGAAGYWQWQFEYFTRREERGQPFSHVSYAATLVALGHYDEAFDRLELAYEARDPNLLSLPSDPTWDPIRSDPRFRELLRKVRRTAWRAPQPPRPP